MYFVTSSNKFSLALAVSNALVLLFVRKLFVVARSASVLQREKIVKNMTVEKIQSLSKKYLDTNKMVWLVVGDAKTQLEPLKKLGFGDPVLLNSAPKAF